MGINYDKMLFCKNPLLIQHIEIKNYDMVTITCGELRAQIKGLLCRFSCLSAGKDVS